MIRGQGWGRRRGLTLIELLAVVVILSMVAGVATVGLAGTSDAAQMQAAVAGWKDLDARARITARSLGPVTLAIDAEGTRLVVRASGGGGGGGSERLAEYQFPRGATGHMEGEGPIDRIEFDRQGRSIDYEVAVALADRVERFSVRGLTGAVMEAKP